MRDCAPAGVFRHLDLTSSSARNGPVSEIGPALWRLPGPSHGIEWQAEDRGEREPAMSHIGLREFITLLGALVKDHRRLNSKAVDVITGAFRLLCFGSRPAAR